MNEKLEDLIYDFVRGEEHAWRTWAKKQRALFREKHNTTYAPAMGEYLAAWRAGHR